MPLWVFFVVDLDGSKEAKDFVWGRVPSDFVLVVDLLDLFFADGGIDLRDFVFARFVVVGGGVGGGDDGGCEEGGSEREFGGKVGV